MTYAKLTDSNTIVYPPATMTNDEREYWSGLAILAGAGAVGVHKLAKIGEVS